jgi:hypothetical protein
MITKALSQTVALDNWLPVKVTTIDTQRVSIAQD